MSDTTNSAPDQTTAPPEPESQAVTPDGTATAEAHVKERTPEQEVEEAKLQVLAAQHQLEAAQNRLEKAQAAVSGMKPQPLLQNPPAPVEASVPSQKESAPPSEADAAAPAPAAVPVTGYGFCNGLFNGLAKIAPLALLVMMCCMAWPIFFEPGKGVYCPAELKSLTAFIHCMTTGSWLAPSGLENGAFTLAQWPGFTWLIALLTLIPGLVDSGLLLPVASFASTFLAVFGVWILALSARFGGRAAFAAGLILLCAPLFAPMPHFVGPAALAAGVMLVAMAFFCQGWLSNSAWFSLPLAFILTAVAGLCGGLLHFATPLIASLIFLIWRGSLRRAQSFDALFGFLLMLAVIGCWLGALMMEESHSQYLNLLMAQSFQFAWPIPWKWVLPIAAGIIGLMPWLLMILGVSWFKVLARAGKTLGASRHTNGSAFVWISFVLALIISLFVPWFHPAAIAIACLGALLLGKAFVNLSHAGNRFFFLLGGLCIIAAGILLILLTVPETQQFILRHLPCKPPVEDLGAKLATLSGLKILGGILIAGGLLAFLFVRKYKACGGLILAAVIVIALCQPARLVLVPELTAMPGTPLVPYAAIEESVKNAMKPAVQPAAAVSTPAVAPADAPAKSIVPTETPPAPAAPAEPAAPAPDSPAEAAPPASDAAESSPPAKVEEAPVPEAQPQEPDTSR